MEQEKKPLKKRIKRFLINKEFDFIRWTTFKFIYPAIYKVNSIKKVDENKVLFVEPTQLKPTNSMKTMLETVKDIGKYDVEFMSLGHNIVRKRYQLQREFKFIKKFATARYVITTEALAIVCGFEKRPETKVVQLWHGCGAFKRFGLSTADYKFGGTLKVKKKYPDYRNEDIITVSSPEVVWAYEEAMDYVDKGVVQATGISRTDVFFDENNIAEARKNIEGKIPQARGKKIIIYAPTFRGRVRTAKAPDQLDIEKMNRRLGEEYVLLIKQHPHVKDRPEVPEGSRDFAFDVTEILSIEDMILTADICISDYSSMIFEYSLFEKPMIFFAYDLEDYNDWRGFYYNYDELTPGPVVDNTENIIGYIENIETEFDKEAVINFKEKFMASCDGHATKRILKIAGIMK